MLIQTQTSEPANQGVTNQSSANQSSDAANQGAMNKSCANKSSANTSSDAANQGVMNKSSANQSSANQSSDAHKDSPDGHEKRNRLASLRHNLGGLLQEYSSGSEDDELPEPATTYNPLADSPASANSLNSSSKPSLTPSVSLQHTRSVPASQQYKENKDTRNTTISEQELEECMMGAM